MLSAPEGATDDIPLDGPKYGHSRDRGHRAVTAGRDIWRTDPATLRDVILDRKAVEARLGDCPPLERVWILSLLDRHEEALDEGHRLLESSGDRFKPLLALAHAYQRRYKWAEAARLQEEALRLSATRTKEALVRHHIGRRLFDEARYRDAAAEFEWASDLYRAAGRTRLAEVSRLAALRSREVYEYGRASWH